tara:strand:- start:379 stop:720 length:342 start_codon:yes stop_codon:yes gene_type:complete
MAIAPGIYDFTIQRGCDHKFNVVFKDSSDSAINLTGWTVSSQVWDEGRTAKAADFAITYVNRSSGSVDLVLTDTQTATFTADEYQYDVLLMEPSGIKEYYLAGTIFMSQGYTR